MPESNREPRPVGPINVVDLFPGERDALLRLLGTLSADEWATPTICAGWSVHDVALHLLGGDIGIISRRRDGFGGFEVRGSRFEDEDRSSNSELRTSNSLIAYINEQNALWVEATRRISPRLLCEFLAMTGEVICTHFAQADQFAVGVPVSWAGPEPAPVWLDTAREYTERWVHQQHIRDAVGRPGLTEPYWLAPVLNTFVRALPYTLRDIVAPDGTAFRLVITGAAGGTWFAVRVHQTWILTTDALAEPDATVMLDQETAWRLWTKGLGKEAARAHVQQEGDTELARAVLEMVSIIA